MVVAALGATDALARLRAGLRPVGAYLGAALTALTGNVRAVIVAGAAAQEHGWSGRSHMGTLGVWEVQGMSVPVPIRTWRLTA